MGSGHLGFGLGWGAVIGSNNKNGALGQALPDPFFTNFTGELTFNYWFKRRRRGDIIES